MRTTLNISPEAMAKVRQLAQQRARPLGDIVSELILEALRPQQAPPVRNGVPLFPAQPGEPPDLELINRLRDAEMEDAYLGAAVLERIRRGEERVLSPADMWHGLDG